MGPDSPRSVPELDTARGVAVVFVALLAGTGVLYAADLFEPAGGIVWVPFHAAVVGLLAAAVVGYRGRRVVAALALAYAPFLGFRLEWALVTISRRPFSDRLAYFFRLDGLAALGFEAVVVGTVGYAVGRLVRRAVVDGRRSAPAE